METLHYTIEVRDKDNKPYINNKGNKVVNAFKFTSNKVDEKSVMFECLDIYNNYRAITGSENVNIHVSRFNELTKTYQLLFSYGREKRFIKH